MKRIETFFEVDTLLAFALKSTLSLFHGWLLGIQSDQDGEAGPSLDELVPASQA